MILLIDHYDSFVFNLARYFERLGQSIQVVRHDALDPHNLAGLEPRAIVLSPGPCGPAQATGSLELLRTLDRNVPVLGVCLGHQIIASVCGAVVERSARPVHGQAFRVRHDGRGIFDGVPNPFVAGRYHSLIVEPTSLPGEFEVSAQLEDGTVMAIRHRTRPWIGVQFHPESVLTEVGYEILKNFLRIAGLPCEADTNRLQAEELPVREPVEISTPDSPVTF